MNIEMAKEAEKIAEELSKKNGLPMELNLTEAYQQIADNIIKKEN